MNAQSSSITPEDIAAWRSHIGRREVRRQWLDSASLQRYAAAVGADLDVERALPPLAHWAYFLEAVAPEALAPDGHQRLGLGILPPVRMAHRMFAAGAMSFHAPPTLHQAAELEITVADVQHKSGRSGDLIVVELERIMTQQGRALISERQTLIYRGSRARTAAVPVKESPPRTDEAVWTPGPVELFRFSAVTFNAHRIHYDLPYAQGEEGYPGLVVHGPLTAVRLFEFASARFGKDGPAGGFEFRALAPLFAGQPVRVAAAAEGRVNAIRCDGEIAMSARWIPAR